MGVQIPMPNPSKVELVFKGNGIDIRATTNKPGVNIDIKKG